MTQAQHTLIPFIIPKKCFTFAVPAVVIFLLGCNAFMDDFTTGTKTDSARDTASVTGSDTVTDTAMDTGSDTSNSDSESETTSERPEDTATNTDNDADTDSNRDTSTSSDTGMVVDTVTDSGTVTDTSTVPDSSTIADTGTITDTGTVTDTGTAADTGTVTDTGTTADTGTVTDTGTAADTGTVTDTGTTADTGTVTDTGTAANPDTDTDTVSICPDLDSDSNCDGWTQTFSSYSGDTQMLTEYDSDWANAYGFLNIQAGIGVVSSLDPSDDYDDYAYRHNETPTGNSEITIDFYYGGSGAVSALQLVQDTYQGKTFYEAILWGRNFSVYRVTVPGDWTSENELGRFSSVGLGAGQYRIVFSVNRDPSTQPVTNHLIARLESWSSASDAYQRLCEFDDTDATFGPGVPGIGIYQENEATSSITQVSVVYH